MALKVRGPVEHFLHLETSGGLVLLLAAAVALIWANSAYAHSYHALWETPMVFDIGSVHGSVDLHFIINDVLMTIFFLLAGLEIKREIVHGELSEIRKAALPIAAAAGGMLAPALIYLAFNPSAPSSSGWGVPMATDIAFAVGILSLLGKRVPASMTILLLALAIIDDLGAILVIAIFYTADFQMSGLGIAGAGIVVLMLWLKIGLRPGPAYLAPLAIIWTGLLVAGVHPTLAGVIVGLATPVKPWLSKEQFLLAARQSLGHFEQGTKDNDETMLLASIRRLHFAAREAISPVVRGLDQMHIWIAFGIMPLFALANAGVDLGGVDFGHQGAMKVMLGIGLGLALGKPLGVLLISWLLVRTGYASLPKGLSWSGMLVIGLTAGIGFTMAIFIAELAFADQPALLALAKLAILIGTAAAALVGLFIGFALLKPVSDEIASLSPSDVERSTEY
ncbi:MAG: Na+/H+ antiporter NhaA [Myxococcales bacterium]|nr:Na+/H+ antiporter NhaA [Myxococcales bacterium]